MLRTVNNNPDNGPYVGSLSKERLYNEVSKISISRHYTEDPENNKLVFQHILDQFLDLEYQTLVLGKDRNILAYSGTLSEGPYTLIGAHYDSVPGTPGADDNGSAVVAMMEVARWASKHLGCGSDKLIYAAFNQEEDGLLGSKHVAQYLSDKGIDLKAAHILEMVGYTSKVQRVPEGLPISFPRDAGDFIALLGNNDTNVIAEILVDAAAKCDLPAVGILTSVPPQMLPSVLHRSDHSSFWLAGYPAILWTDTAEYRSNHYHRKTDSPDTLDYDFMAKVIQTLIEYIG